MIAIKKEDLTKIKECELFIAKEHDLIKSYHDADEVKPVVEFETLAFNDNSLSFKFVQTIDPNYFKRHLNLIREQEKDF